MPNLTNLSPASSYGTLLALQTNPLSSTLQPVGDGLGNLSALEISTIAVNVNTSMGPFYINGTALTATATQINSVCAQNTFLGTTGVIIPNGTTAQRPISPTTGELRYNSNTDQIEGYLSSGWSTLNNTVSSVSGTAGQIIATPTTGNVVVSIDPTYIGQSSITTLGTITSGTWHGSILLGQYGGTGVNNSGKTITLGGNLTTAGALTTSGAFSSTFTMTGDTNVTFPTSGTLLTGATGVTSVSGTTNQINSTGGTTPVLSFSSTAVFPGTVTLNQDPVSALQAVTKQYADAIAANINYKNAAYAASTVALTVTYSNGAAGVGATLTNATTQATFSIDGTTPAVSSRILIKNQADATQNGIYTVTNVGSGATNWVLTRSTDYNTPAQIFPGNVVPVNNGTVNGATSWLETATVTTIGTDPISFTQYTFANPVTSVSGTSNRITSTGGQTPIIDIAATYVGQTSITTLGTIGTGTWQGSVVGLTYGGTNANLTASNGGIFYSTATAGAILSGTATANQALLSGTSSAPSWSTATYPASTTVSQLLYSSSSNVITGLATANNGVLVTSAGGVPSIGSTLPSAVQGNITSVGTIASGTWQGSIIGLAYGGTNANLTADNGGIVYSTASALAILAATSTAGKLLLSGSSAAPTWSAHVELTDDGSNLALTDALGAFSGGPIDNTVFGIGIMQSALNGANENSCFGYQAGHAITTGDQNCIYGYQAGIAITTGSTSCAFGNLALNAATTVDSNCAFGNVALEKVTTSSNCAFGSQAGQNNVSGLVLSAFGAGALQNSTGDSNSGFGYNVYNLMTSGNNNTGAGANAGAARATYNNCTFIGYGADADVSGLTNATAIGYNAVVHTSNSLVLGNGANVGIGTTSPTALLHVVGTSILGTVSSGTWNGSVIGLTYGGLNAALTASNGGIFYSTASAGAILSGTATANQVLLSGTNAAPSWSTATYPASTTINQLLYSSSANVVAGLATANSGVLITSSGGVPSISSTLPSAVQGNITSTGTITSGTWTGTTIAVANGGTGVTASDPVIQVVRASTTTVVTCNVAIPIDNTIPQNTEGVEVLTATITPKSTSNILEFRWLGTGSMASSASAVCSALYQDSTANALACESTSIGNTQIGIISLSYYMTAGTTSSTTFKIRVGPTSNTFYLNGDNTGTRVYGGVCIGTLIIKEYAT